ncbi:MAG: ParB N-terminal domain-containing protein [Nitrospirae bacterium]|nr:ParB N-terminal domain-containing protein [Nitrospirota bacterium]
MRISDIKVEARKVGDAEWQRIEELASSISTIGLLSPITITPANELITGFCKIEACKLLGIEEIDAIQKDFDKIQIKLARIDENLFRKHLKVLEIGELLNERDELLESLGLRAKVGDNQFKAQADETMKHSKTTKTIAKELGIGERNAQLKRQIAKDITKPVRDIIRDTPLADNQVSLLEISKLEPEEQQVFADNLPKKADRDSVLQVIKQIKRNAKISSMQKKAKGYKPDNSIQMIHGDFIKECKNIADNSIDAIITDPPYPKEFLPLWKELGITANRVLKPGGFLIAYSGKIYLDTVMDYLKNAGLKYYWMFNIVYKGNCNPKIPFRRVHELSRPVLIYSKPPIKVQDEYFKDTYNCTTMEKEFHDWQQANEPFQYLIKKFSKPDETILDPFVCTGTVALASLMEQRKCIGMDVDEKMIKVAKGRIQEYLNSQKKAA